MTIAGRAPGVAGAIAARSARALASGSAGSVISRSSAPAFDASTPAFAHTNPWRVRQISTPGPTRTSSAVWSSTTCTARGSLPCSSAMKRARAVGADVREIDDRALRLRHDLVRDHEDVSGLEAARALGRRRDQRRQVVARGDLRDPLRAGRPAAPSSPAHAAERVARVDGGAPGRVGERLGAARRDPRACRRRASARRSRRSARSPRPPVRAARGAHGCPSPKLGSITSGGVSSSAFVPVPWRSGTITTSGPSDSMRTSSSISAAWTARGVARRAAARGMRPRRGPIRSRAAPPRCARRWGSPRPPARRRCGPSTSALGSPVTTTTSSTLEASFSVSSTSVSIPVASATRSDERRPPSPRRRLAISKRLTGRTTTTLNVENPFIAS